MSKDTSIYELELSGSCFQRLHKLNVQTVGDILALPSTEPFSPRNVAELRAALSSVGYAWSAREVPFVHRVTEEVSIAVTRAPDDLTIDAIWQRIEKSLWRYGPKLLEHVGPPATIEQLAGVERAIGAPLPDDVRASYLIHDGAEALFGGELLSLSLVVDEWRALTDLEEQGVFDNTNILERRGPVKPVWWSRGWIPLLADGGGNNRCVDLDPLTPEHRGQLIHFWHDEGMRSVEAPDFRSWLASLLEELEAGVSTGGDRINYYEHDDGKPFLATE